MRKTYGPVKTNDTKMGTLMNYEIGNKMKEVDKVKMVKAQRMR